LFVGLDDERVDGRERGELTLGRGVGARSVGDERAIRRVQISRPDPLPLSSRLSATTLWVSRLTNSGC
jgi:hypothetical protein